MGRDRIVRRIQYAMPILIVGIVLSTGIYVFRSVQAQSEEPQAPRFGGSGYEPNVEGRLLDWGEAEGENGENIEVFCEYDAFVHIRGGLVTDIRDGAYGPSIEASKGHPLERGEVVIEASDTGDFPVRVYRDEDGALRKGCAPESVIIETTPIPRPPINTPRA